MSNHGQRETPTPVQKDCLHPNVESSGQASQARRVINASRNGSRFSNRVGLSILNPRSLRLGLRARILFNQVRLTPALVRTYERLNPAQSLGDRGEREAERHLLRKGLIIVARGYSDKFGEIDLIAVDGETIVFVEVKTRRSDFAGAPAEAVDDRKQAKITRTATGYLKFNHLTECSARFDVIAITWPDDTRPPEVVHYENAFEQSVSKFQLF